MKVGVFLSGMATAVQARIYRFSLAMVEVRGRLEDGWMNARELLKKAWGVVDRLGGGGLSDVVYMLGRESIE